jgi:hypothetical protein
MSKKVPLNFRVTVENINVPGYKSTVDGTMYQAMYHALMTALPAKAPGLSQAEMTSAVVPFLPAALFPGGAKAGWWIKCVQLDREVKGDIIREDCKPLRWHRSSENR